MAAETAILLLHGWCGGAWVWRGQTGLLTGQAEVVAADLDPGRIGLTIADAAEEVQRLARLTEARSLVLIGHSLGGAVAVEAAIRLGRRCRLILGIDSFTDALFYRRRDEPEIAARLSPFADDFAGRMAEMVARITPGASPALSAEIARVMAAAAPAANLAQMRALLGWDIEAAWPRLPCPAAAILSRPLYRAATALTLPGLREIFMDSVGHFPMLEAPDRFNAVLTEALGDWSKHQLATTTFFTPAER